MMTPATVSDLLEVLRELRLLEAGRLEALAQQRSRFGGPEALAKALVNRDWLTPLQANYLLRGQAADLRLGPYLLLERLGGGGMGEVFKARDTRRDCLVALKLIRKDRLKHPTALRRFQREVRASSQLSHPHIAAAIDSDQAGQTLYYVMEYIDGTDLARLVKQSGPLPIALACEYVRQAALGLHHAHERGLVHRDIKPSNLLVTRHRQLKILDLGLARMDHTADGESLDTLTEEGAVLGTLDYLAPEQALNSRQADIRSDLYSLGCTFYFLLTGRAPFAGGTATEKLLKHRLESPPPVEQLRPDTPPWVAKIVRKLMAKDPRDRFQSPAELALALQSHGPPRSPADRVRRLGQQAAGAWQWCRRHPRLAGGAALAVVVLIALVGLVGREGNRKPAAEPPPRSSLHPVLGYELRKHPPEAVKFHGHWYAYYPDPIVWEEALKRCQQMGGYLACVGNQQEHQFLVELVKGDRAWLGGFEKEPKNWFWVTGEPIDKPFWNSGQPNSGPNAVTLLNKNGRWEDIGVGERSRWATGFVCEWEH